MREIKIAKNDAGQRLDKFLTKALDLPIGLLYKSMNLKDKLPTMTEEEQLRLLATDGMLVKRPIVITEDHIFTGFKETEWSKLL